jgi:uncharacterized protein YecT (DUF1311 family)
MIEVSMKRTAVILFFVGFMLLTATEAQRRTLLKQPCENSGTQAAASACAHREYQAANAELNKAYNHLSTKLDVDERARLKEAELAWIQYRDKNCEYESSFYLGGTMRPMIESFCLARVTKARMAELRDQLRFQQEQ